MSENEPQGTMKRLMAYQGKYKYFMFASWILSAISGCLSIGAYICIYYVAEALLSTSENALQQASQYGWLAVKFTMGAFSVYGISLLLSHITAFSTMAILRVKMVQKLGRVPLGYHINHPSGTLRKEIEKNAENIEAFVAHRLPDAVQSMVMPIAFLISTFYFDWRIALVCLIPVMIGFAALSSMLKTESKSFIEDYQAALGDMGNAAVEYVRGITVVKTFNQTIHSFKRFSTAINKYKDFAVKYVMSMQKPMSIYITSVNGIFFVLIPVSILLFNGSSNQEKVIYSLIFFTLFVPLVSVILMKMMNTSSNMMMASQALDAIERILNEHELVNGNDVDLPSKMDISFESVSFQYEEGTEKVLNQLSFTAKEGKITALVGASGSGKTTVANLIARFWLVDEGKITVGGKDISELDYHEWMKNLSFVFQDPNLLKMSIAENVSFCSSKKDEVSILKALHDAQCDDILEKLPDGIHTVIGEKGVYLSGGEQQRIALARALMQDSKVVLLDEVTAYVDPENENRIQKVLNMLMRHKTVIMIAHRLSTVKDADHIIVLDKGEILEEGTHEALIKNNGRYSTMFKEYNTGMNWKIGSVQHG